MVDAVADGRAEALSATQHAEIAGYDSVAEAAAAQA